MELPEGRADWAILKWEEQPELDSEAEFSGGYSSEDEANIGMS